MIIRPYAMQDLPEMARMAIAFADEAYGGGCAPDVFVKFIIQITTNGSGAVFMLEKDGKPVGGAGVMKAQHWFKGHEVAEEMFWWIEPEHRGGRGALLLFNAIEDWYETSGAKELIVTHTEKINPEKTAKFYLKRGFEKMETKFVRRANA